MVYGYFFYVYFCGSPHFPGYQRTGQAAGPPGDRAAHRGRPRPEAAAACGLTEKGHGCSSVSEWARCATQSSSLLFSEARACSLQASRRPGQPTPFRGLLQDCTPCTATSPARDLSLFRHPVAESTGGFHLCIQLAPPVGGRRAPQRRGGYRRPISSAPRAGAPQQHRLRN